MMQDLESKTQKWGSSGRFIPFEDIYDVSMYIYLLKALLIKFVICR